MTTQRDTSEADSPTVEETIDGGLNAGPTDPPPYDVISVGRVVEAGIEIENIVLVGAHFERIDDHQPIPSSVVEPTDPPELGIARPEWEIDQEKGRLGCIFTFMTTFPDPEPYEVIARFRLTYTFNAEVELVESDVQQFVNWNAVFNAWPYWREYLTSTVNRAGLPRFLAPVMAVPR